MINQKRVFKLIFSVCICLLIVVIYPGIAAAADNINCEIEIEYSLPNGYSYKLAPSLTDHREIDYREGPAEKFDIEYVFVLPALVKNTELTFSADVQIKDIENNILAEGRTFVLDEDLYIVNLQDKEYVVRIIYASDIPQIYMNIDNDDLVKVHADKNNKASGYVTITDGHTIEYSGNLEYIKGRGNATWDEPQKPYSIKLASKSSLFGMEASKKFALLTNYVDYTCIKNKVALDFANQVGIEYTPQAQMADLYINNKYYGNYVLTERVEIDEARINIFDIDIINETFNPGTDFENLQLMGVTGEDSWETRSSYKWFDLPNQAAVQIDGGYLLELEFGGRYKKDEAAGFVTAYGQPVVLKSPEYASKEQVEYIMDYYQQFEDALMSDSGYNSKGKHYSEYIDVPSFAKMYVFQELVQNLDAGISSAFMYKDIDGKLVAGPVWDMDHSLSDIAVRFDKFLGDSENIWVADGERFASLEGKTLFALLWMHADFRHEAVVQWNEYFKPKIESLQQNWQYQGSLTSNSVIASQYICKNIYYASSLESVEDYYNTRFDTTEAYITDRAEFMNGFLDSDKHYIIYARNGGSGVMLDPLSYAVNDTAVVKDTEYTYGDITFIGWNTEADGSGDWYYPEDRITVNDKDIILYAQWQGMGAAEVYQAHTYHTVSIWEYIIEKLKNVF